MSDFDHKEWIQNRDATENIPSLTKSELEKHLQYFNGVRERFEVTSDPRKKDTCKERIASLREEINHRRSRKPSWTAIASLFIALAGLCLGIYNCSQTSSTQAGAESTPMTTPQPSPTGTPSQ